MSKPFIFPELVNGRSGPLIIRSLRAAVNEKHHRGRALDVRPRRASSACHPTAAADSLRTARESSSVTNKPEPPPWVPGRQQRGHGIGAAVQDVTVTSASVG